MGVPNRLPFHPLKGSYERTSRYFGKPWLATSNAFIGCREGEMTISNGFSIQKLITYPPSQPIMENIWWLECPYENDYCEELILPSEDFWELQEHTT